MGLRFFAGGAIGFDALAAKTVLEVKKDYPFVRLILVFPFAEQCEKFCGKDKEEYDFIMNSCDEYIYTSEKYVRDCFYKRATVIWLITAAIAYRI